LTITTAPAHSRLALTRRAGVWLLVGLLAFLPMLGSTRAVAQTRAGEEGGELPDGTQYLMKVPPNWNGTLIRDLDYASGSNAPRWGALYANGYALAGTGRHRLRLYQYDPQREITNLDLVLEMFDKRFGNPKRV